MARFGQLNNIWGEIFKSRNIAQDLDRQGYHIVTANELREYAEPRLLTKFDEENRLPAILLKHQCAPLAITGDSYALICPANIIFHRLEGLPVNPHFIPFKKIESKFCTIPWEQYFTSEPQAIDAAYLSGILGEFLGDNDIHLTIRGKRVLQEDVPLSFSSAKGKLNLPFSAKSVQIEIDAGYESLQGIYLLEAKTSLPEDFNLRQLYYPYHYWNSYLKHKGIDKPIRLIFLAYLSHYFYLFEYQFEDPGVFNSIYPVQTAWYILGEPRLSRQVLSGILKEQRTIQVRETPFPQADTFARVLGIVEKAKRSGEIRTEDLTSLYQFTSRQGNYYAAAAIWLGWLRRKPDNSLEATKTGKELLLADVNSRLDKIIMALVSRPVFREAIEFLLAYGDVPSLDNIQTWIRQAIKEEFISKMDSDTTIKRRAQTVLSWMNYIQPFIKE